MRMTLKSLGLGRHRSGASVVAASKKLAGIGDYIACDDGIPFFHASGPDTGHSGPEWMADMLSAYDPFVVSESERGHLASNREGSRCSRG